MGLVVFPPSPFPSAPPIAGADPLPSPGSPDQRPAPDRADGRRVIAVAAAGLVLCIVTFVAGVAVGRRTDTEPQAPAAPSTSVPTGEQAGSPIPRGRVLSLPSGWTVKVFDNQIDPRGATGYMTNTPVSAKAGSKFVAVTILAANESREAGWGQRFVMFALMTSGGEVMSEYRKCVTPDESPSTTITGPGGTERLYLCFEVPADRVDSAVLVARPLDPEPNSFTNIPDPAERRYLALH